MSADKPSHTLLADYLCCLGVPHTEDYSRICMETMPFQTLFGLSKALQDYGVDSVGYRLGNLDEISRLTPPFIARTVGGMVIVTAVDNGKVSYLTQGVEAGMPLDEFKKVWRGEVMLSFPKEDACEPGYAAHRRMELLRSGKKWVLAGCALVLLLYLIISRGLYYSWPALGLVAIDCFGLYISYLLVQKSLNIHNPAADRVCGVLEEGGCDSILEMKASKFFGLFGWSEVGLAYFTVSLFSLLLLPSTLPWLALCNVCCLPFTVWSIWYQRFKARRWCTLCVCVQCSLWLLFLCYISGDWLRMAWPPGWGFVMLGVAYLGVMLAINAVMPLIDRNDKNQNNEDES